MRVTKGPDREAAETVGARGLAFLASDPQRLSRFLVDTGIGPDDLKAAIGTQELAVAVLEHLLGDESLLLVFAADTGVRPEDVEPALRALKPGIPEY